ncbi:MAG: HAMP domain-containing methyl-accepting chemotaxis protein [Butyrivibrio sp.]|nr:HAMP domain-containing methyl-accepting chemotaxis protein [Butyrivibrio sp.]
MGFLKGLIKVSKEKIENISVAEKFKFAFNAVLTRIIVLLVMFFIMGGVSVLAVYSMYNTYYMQSKWQAEIRIDIQSLSKACLWAIAAEDTDEIAEQVEAISSKFADINSSIDELDDIYSGENMTTLTNDLGTLEKYTNEMVSLFNSGADDPTIYEYFKNTLYEQVKVCAADMKVVGSESQTSSLMAYKISLFVIIIINIIAIIATILTYLLIISSRNVLSASVTGPVNTLKRASEDMANGRLDLDISYSSTDELGDLANDLNRSTDVIKNIVGDISDTLERMAGGDFSHGSSNPEIYVGDYVAICDAIEDISHKLSNTLSQVKDSSSQVSQGAMNMSQGATSLAEGATDQAAAIEELTASVTTVTEQTKLMAQTAKESRTKAAQVKDDAENSAMKMHLVTDAMTRITEASNEIETITNSIEGIAKQTQLLALNASIEAARAGEAGKGFAVVAGEISALATQSTEAAKNTHQLIEDTMDEIKNGNAVVAETTEALDQVQTSVSEIVEMIRDTEEMASRQSQSMNEIDQGIEQISNVVQSNSATAQESSAVSQELSDQSDNLNDLISQFSISN